MGRKSRGANLRKTNHNPRSGEWSDFPVRVRDLGVKGRGILAVRNIRKGELILSSQICESAVLVRRLDEVCATCFGIHRTGYTYGCIYCGALTFCSKACQEHRGHSEAECKALLHCHGLLSSRDNDGDSSSAVRVAIHYFAQRNGMNRNGNGSCSTQGVYADETLLGLGHGAEARMKSNWNASIAHKALTSAQIEVSYEEVVQFFLRLGINGLTAISHGAPTSLVLAPAAAMVNHSCRPNAQYSAQGACINIHAVQDIKKGAEVLILYIDPYQSKSSRQARLQSLSCFTCTCERCSDPAEIAVDAQMSGYKCLVPGCNGCMTDTEEDGAGGMRCTSCSVTISEEAEDAFRWIAADAEQWMDEAEENDDDATRHSVLDNVLKTHCSVFHNHHAITEQALMAVVKVLMKDMTVVNLQQAISHVTTVIKRRNAIYNQPHPKMAQTCGTLVMLFKELATHKDCPHDMRESYWDAAIHHAELACTIYGVVYGEVHPDTIIASRLLGKIRESAQISSLSSLMQ